MISMTGVTIVAESSSLRDVSVLVVTVCVLRRGDNTLSGDASGSCVERSRREARVVGLGVTLA